jgi:protein-tyrosine phosphatase
VNAQPEDAPPAGMSRREWREKQATTDAKQATTSEQPVALPDFLGGPAPAQQPRSALTILTVCTGNICRSPLAEILLRAHLEPLGVRVHSAGTHALVGHGMPDFALELAHQAGVDPQVAAAHQARYLVEPLLGDADLILTMAREHRSHVVKMMPNRLRRTFTIREFARLAATLATDDARAAADAAGGSSQDRFAAVLRAVVDQRGLTPANVDEDDVIDPYRRSRETYALSGSQLVPTIDEVERIVRVAID